PAGGGCVVVEGDGVDDDAGGGGGVFDPAHERAAAGFAFAELVGAGVVGVVHVGVQRFLERAAAEVEELHAGVAAAGDEAVGADELEVELIVAVVEQPAPGGFDRTVGDDAIDNEEGVRAAEEPEAGEFGDGFSVERGDFGGDGGDVAFAGAEQAASATINGRAGDTGGGVEDAAGFARLLENVAFEQVFLERGAVAGGFDGEGAGVVGER